MRLYYTVLAILLLVINADFLHAQGPLHPTQKIPLPKVQGRIDHMAVDIIDSRLFIAALGNNSVEIVDLKTGSVMKSIKGLNEPQGIAFVPEFNKLFVTNGGDGRCNVYDCRSLLLLDTLRLKNDADNIRYDGFSKSLYIGYGKGAIGFIDAAIHRRLGDIQLKGHPESFQLERSTGRIYVNVPSAGHIAVIDLKSKAVIETWPVTGSNYPMALIEDRHQLLVVTRNPSKLLILDTRSGRRISDLQCVSDADDVFYDAKKERIYVSGGEGFIDVFGLTNSGNYQHIARTRTAPHARTSLWVPELNRLFVAVPADAQREAVILVFEATAR